MQQRSNEQLAWYGDVLRALVIKEITVRYKNSYLGFLWSILNPLANALILNMVFGSMLGMGNGHYLVVLLSGLFPWQWFSNSVGGGPHAFLANSTLVKRVAFPRWLIPFVSVLRDMVHFIISLPIYICFLIGFGMHPTWMWIYSIPLLLVLSIFMIYGLALFFATVNLFFRDLGNLVIIILNLLFYGTPIMYTVDKIPPRFASLLALNPISPLFTSWRNVLLHNMINLHDILLTIVYSIIFILLGAFAYRVLNKRFAEAM